MAYRLSDAIFSGVKVAGASTADAEKVLAEITAPGARRRLDLAAAATTPLRLTAPIIVSVSFLLFM
jgi:hypothetical protein